MLRANPLARARAPSGPRKLALRSKEQTLQFEAKKLATEAAPAVPSLRKERGLGGAACIDKEAHSTV